MRVRLGIVVLGIGLLCSGTRMVAHHSAAVEYDDTKVVTLKGTVTKIEWTNPHAKFLIDVVDETKTVTSWSFELASPNSLTRSGWGKRTLTVGDTITATGAVSRSGKPMAVTRSVTTADGKKLFSGTMGIEDQ